MRYSDERREAILKKLLPPHRRTAAPPHRRTVAEVAEEEGIPVATLYNWRKAARRQGRLLAEHSAEPEGWSSRDKFNAVLETAALSEAVLAEYCRRCGLYPEQIRRWRASSCRRLFAGRAEDPAQRTGGSVGPDGAYTRRPTMTGRTQRCPSPAPA